MNRSRVIALLCGVALAVPLSAAPVLAQLPPEKRPDVLLEQQRKQQEQQKKQEQLTQHKAPPQIDKTARTRPPKGTEAKAKVTQFKFRSNTVTKR